MIFTVLGIELALTSLFVVVAATSVSVFPGLAAVLVAALGGIVISLTVGLLKGHGITVFWGLVGCLLWGLGIFVLLYAGLRLARPASTWATTFYGEQKMRRAQSMFGPKKQFSKICERCGHSFWTPVATAKICDQCRGGNGLNPLQLVIPAAIFGAVAHHQQRPPGQ